MFISNYPVPKCKARPRRGGFTLIELLVVMGLIAILMSLLMPAVGRVRASAKEMQCVSNQGRIAMAWLDYVNDNDHLLVCATPSPAQMSWATDGNFDSNIQSGALFKYLQDTSVYKCPGDTDLLNLRSYSMNWMLNGEAGASGFSRYEEIKVPAKCFVTVEEYDPRGYNWGSFDLPLTGDSWIDFLPNFHKSGFVLSFADGRAEYWKCDDPRTLSQTWFWGYTPNNPDLKRFQASGAGKL